MKCFFLAANQDAVMTGSRYGFSPDYSLTFGANYQQTQNIQYYKNIKNGTKFSSYTTKDGFKISNGDILTIGKNIAVNDASLVACPARQAVQQHGDVGRMQLVLAQVDNAAPSTWHRGQLTDEVAHAGAIFHGGFLIPAAQRFGKDNALSGVVEAVLTVGAKVHDS